MAKIFLICTLVFLTLNGKNIEFPDFNLSHKISNNKDDINLFKEIYNKNKIDNNIKQINVLPLIPLKIHQIWIGPKTLPDKFKWMIETWKKKHSNWTYKLWTNEDLKDFKLKNQKVFDMATNWGAKADILRYEILNREGGVYVDIDFECLQPLDILNQNYNFYCCIVENTNVIANGIIGSIANHPILQKCIDDISRIKGFKGDFQSVWELTGPGVFTNAVRQYISVLTNQSKIIALPSSFFFPFPGYLRFDFWSKRLSRKDILSYFKPESFAVHYWATSWQEN